MSEHPSLAHIHQAQASLAEALAAFRASDLPAAIPAPWMSTAEGELAAGVREIAGAQHNLRILEYLATCSRAEGGNLGPWGAGRDETPWCSAFVSWCVLRAGLESTHSAAARSWRDYGQPCEFRRGAIVVLSRQGGGHVGFAAYCRAYYFSLIFSFFDSEAGPRAVVLE